LNRQSQSAAKSPAKTLNKRLKNQLHSPLQNITTFYFFNTSTLKCPLSYKISLQMISSKLSLKRSNKPLNPDIKGLAGNALNELI